MEFFLAQNRIILIENYHPPRIYKVLESDTKESILSKGYEFQNEQIEENDIILLTKIEGKKHIVRPLETLENIANSYFIDKADIINRNNLKTEKLFALLHLGLLPKCVFSFLPLLVYQYFLAL